MLDLIVKITLNPVSIEAQFRVVSAPSVFNAWLNSRTQRTHFFRDFNQGLCHLSIITHRTVLTRRRNTSFLEVLYSSNNNAVKRDPDWLAVLAIVAHPGLLG